MRRDIGRYRKQALFPPIGEAGQARIVDAQVAIIGLGALGSVSAELLARGGVGRLRLVDRDFVELDNLQRQTLYDERDAELRLPKAIAAKRKLEAVNGSIEIEAIVADVNPDVVLELLRDIDVVIDGTDNIETRLLLNDACLKMGVPWVYGGALGSSGSVMAVLPGRTACLRCLIDAPPAGSLPTCDTMGVLAMTTHVVAALQATRALQIIVGADVDTRYVSVDVWEGDVHLAEVLPRPDCPAHAGRYDYLSGARLSWTTVLCGRDAVQITPTETQTLSLDALEDRLKRIGPVTNNGFLLSVPIQGLEMLVFADGRAIIKGTTDMARARALYARYIGL